MPRPRVWLRYPVRPSCQRTRPCDLLPRPWGRPLSLQALCVRGEGYSFEETAKLLTHLDTELEERNPGAIAVLKQYGLHPTDAA